MYLQHLLLFSLHTCFRNSGTQADTGVTVYCVNPTRSTGVILIFSLHSQYSCIPILIFTQTTDTHRFCPIFPTWTFPQYSVYSSQHSQYTLFSSYSQYPVDSPFSSYSQPCPVFPILSIFYSSFFPVSSVFHVVIFIIFSFPLFPIVSLPKFPSYTHSYSSQYSQCSVFLSFPT